VFRKAKTALGSQEARAEARQTQQTDFSEMTASFHHQETASRTTRTST